MRFTALVIAGTSLSMLSVVACGDTTEPESVASVVVTPSTATLVSLGETVQFTASARDASGNSISGETFTWSSSDEIVATVSSTGLATAVSNGSATITATADGVQGSASLTVTQALSSVEVTPTSATLVSLGETLQLTASASDASGNAISGKTFTWSSSDEGIATVSSSGLVTAVTNGSVTITATTDGFNGAATALVDQVGAQLAFTVEPPTLAEATVPLTPAVEAIILDALGNAVTDATDAVTVAIGTNPSGGILFGTTTVNAAAGVASFSALSIDRAGTGYTLVATSGNLSSATSATFTVVSGGTWTLTGNMGLVRLDHTATLLNDGKVLIVGSSQTAELYDPATGSFTATGSTVFNHGQNATATRLLDGTVLIVGGSGARTSAEIYDPATGTFSLTASTNADRVFHTATLLSDGRVLLAGGQDPSPQTHAAAELYDPATGTFSPTGSLNDDRSTHAATLLPDGRVLVLGGVQTTTPGFGICLTSAEIYDPASGTFSTTTGSMQEERCGTRSILLATGRVLVVGEFTKAGELFDPASGTFGATGSMATLHSGGTATLLPDGTVLIAGGATTDAAELYDPASGLFIQLAASMNEERQEHTATVLLDGRVLVTGGFSFGVIFIAYSSAELYSVRIP